MSKNVTIKILLLIIVGQITAFALCVYVAHLERRIRLLEERTTEIKWTHVEKIEAKEKK